MTTAGNEHEALHLPQYGKCHTFDFNVQTADLLLTVLNYIFINHILCSAFLPFALFSNCKMNIYIIYPSSAEFWINCDVQKLIGYTSISRHLFKPQESYYTDSRPSIDTGKILKYLPCLSEPIYIGCADHDYKSLSKHVIFKRRSFNFDYNCFVSIRSGNDTVFIESPELTFLEAAGSMDLIDLILFGYNLCSARLPANTSRPSQTNRFSYTSVQLINDFLSTAGIYKGIRTARLALRYVLDNSNSEIETRLGIMSMLPLHLGGYEMSGLLLNHPVELTTDAKRLTNCSIIHADLTWPARKCAIDYNSDEYHLNSKSHSIDANRIAAFQFSGYRLIPATVKDIRRFEDLDILMTGIRNMMKFPDKTELLDKYEITRGSLYKRLFKEWTNSRKPSGIPF
ncbi:MAG: hypothetical protein HUJ76_12260 [Parasporobacterium sp.]|nr:hypothetical protein [Parasporobacterium sp.]